MELFPDGVGFFLLAAWLNIAISWRLTANDFTGPRSTNASPSVAHNQRKYKTYKQ